MKPNELIMYELSPYSTEDIRATPEYNRQIIADKVPNTRATNAFWKAVENRQKLITELTVRGEAVDFPEVPLPADRLPLLTI